MSSSSPFLNLNQYKIVKSIGEGSYGFVFLVKDRDNQKIYAAKISKEEIAEKKDDGSDDLLYLFREIKIMSALNHPSIIQYIGYNPKNFDGKPNPTIITEYASNGTLGKIIQLEMSKKPPSNWNETKKLICIYGIASGMAYLHQHKVIHRDLKPDNILMDDNLYPKITDFGLSKITDSIYASLNIKSMDGSKGSPLFMAPEIMCEEAYSTASDVYAFSMIVYILITGLYPFSKVRNLVELMTKLQTGKRPTIPSDTPQVYAQLIEKCWSQDVSERPSFEEIVNELKTNEEFISYEIDEDEFKKFVNDVDNYDTTFDISKSSFHLNNFITADDETQENANEQTNDNANKSANESSNSSNKHTKISANDNVSKSSNDSNIKFRKNIDNDKPISEDRQIKSASLDEPKIQPTKIKKCHTMLPQSPPILNSETNPKIEGKPNINLRVTFIGDFKSGKQQLIHYIMDLPVQSEAQPSNGKIEYVHNYFGEQVKFEINDTSGQEEFIISRMKSYEDTNVFVFVFSMIDKESLKNAKTKWKDDIRDFREKSIILLVGVDLEKWSNNNSKFVTQSEIDDAEQTIGATLVIKGSYQTGENVDKLKNKIIESYIKYFYQKEQNDDEKDSPKKKKKTKKEIDFKVLLVGNNNSGQYELLDYIDSGKVSNDNDVSPLKRVDKKVTFHGKKVNLHLFGTPGIEELQTIRLLTYQNSDVVLLVFSLIKKETFHALLRKYLKEVKSFANGAAIILVGVDLEKWEKNDYNRDFVHEAELEIVTKDPDIQQFILCSYVTGEHLDKFSEKIVEAYLMKTNDKSCNIA